MAVATLPAFALDGAVGASFGPTTSNVALPGTTVSTDAVVIVTNTGSLPVWVKLGTAGVTVAMGQGVVVLPGLQRVLTQVSTYTNIAGITQGGSTAYTTALYASVTIETGT